MESFNPAKTPPDATVSIPDVPASVDKNAMLLSVKSEKSKSKMYFDPSYETE